MIEIKPKKCKGTGLAKGYGCGKSTLYRKYGLCKNNCYPDWLLNSENGRLKLEKATLKATKPRRELEQATKEQKASKGLATLLTNTKNACHTYVKKRDHGKPCISCGTPWKPNFQAGHYYKAELFSSLKFHEDNIHGQCEQCNLRKEGNLNNYELRLPFRIGKEKFENLKRLAASDKQVDFKWDREQLKEIRKDYLNRIKNI